MKKHRLPSSLLALLVASACDAAVMANAQPEEVPPVMAAEAAARATPPEEGVAVIAARPGGEKIKPSVEAAAFDLESVSFIVKKGKVKDAQALEKQINDPREKINNVDADGDGKVDRIQVVEIRLEAEGAVVFELRAIPSSSKDKDAAILIATIDFTPDKVTQKLVVKAVYAPIVVGHEAHVFQYVVPIEVKGDVIVVVDSSPFYGWLFTFSRPAYYGVYLYEAAPPPVIVVEHGGCWPPGHCKHGKGKGKGKWH